VVERRVGYIASDKVGEIGGFDAKRGLLSQSTLEHCSDVQRNTLTIHSQGLKTHGLCSRM
jgi:hypothetical protein